MRFLPKKKPQALSDKIKSWRDDQIQEAIDEDKVTVVGVRGYYLDSMGKGSKNDRGIYDDASFIFAPNVFLSFNFNTDPSGYRRGRASLESPQIVTYKPGYHGYGRKSGHMAFRQASDVVVRRDGGEGNGERLKGTSSLFKDKEGSRFWINLHKGGRLNTSSAGCQTIPAGQWDAFYSTMRMLLKRHEQKDFQYHLINEPRIKDPKGGYYSQATYKQT